MINSRIKRRNGEVLIVTTIFIAWLTGTIVGGLTDEIKSHKYDRNLSKLKNEMRVYIDLYSSNPELRMPTFK